MRRTLLLVRHAKSSWDDPDLADRDRPLNKRGLRDAPAMARRVAQRAHRPERIVTSPALRARRTAEAMAAALALEPEARMVDERLYDAMAEDLLEVIRALDPRLERVMLVGHHPGMTDVANLLAGAALAKIPTCGVAELSLHVAAWADAGADAATLSGIESPKAHAR
jgi:phosphohistidine phosphatase